MVVRGTPALASSSMYTSVSIGPALRPPQLRRPAGHEPAGVEHAAGPARGPSPARAPVDSDGVGAPSPRRTAGSPPATRGTRRGTPRPSSSNGSFMRPPQRRARAAARARARWVAAVPNRSVAGLRPLQPEVEVVLPREADAAVQLEAVAGEQPLAVAGRRLGQRRGHRPARVVLGDGEGGEVGERGGPLDREVAVGQAVLERLERADRPAELLAVLGVLERGLEDGAARGDRRQRQRGGGLLHRPLDRVDGSGIAGCDEHPLAVHRDRSSARSASGIVGSITRAAVALTAAPGTTNTPSPPARPARAGDHRDLVGGGAVEHRGLHAVEHPAVAVGAGGRRDVGELEAVAFGQRQRARPPFAHDRAEERDLLLGRARLAHHRRELRGRRQQRTRRGGPPELLGQQRQLDVRRGRSRRVPRGERGRANRARPSWPTARRPTRLLRRPHAPTCVDTVPRGPDGSRRAAPLGRRRAPDPWSTSPSSWAAGAPETNGCTRSAGWRHVGSLATAS